MEDFGFELIEDLLRWAQGRPVAQCEALAALARIRQQAQEREEEITRLRQFVARAASAAYPNGDPSEWSRVCDEAGELVMHSDGIHAKLTAEEKPGFLTPREAKGHALGILHRAEAERFAIAEAEAATEERRECSSPLPGHNVTVVQTGEKTKFITPAAQSPAPATECTCRVALGTALQFISEPEFYKANRGNFITAVRLALSSPCPCEGLGEELGSARNLQEITEQSMVAQAQSFQERENKLRAELAAANLRAGQAEWTRNLAQAASTRDVEAKRLVERERDAARKHLADAVDALRIFAENQPVMEAIDCAFATVTRSSVDKAAAVVLRFDVLRRKP